MEGVACFFFELKASKFASHGSGNLGLTCTYFPAWASIRDGMSTMDCLDRQSLKTKMRS